MQMDVPALSYRVNRSVLTVSAIDDDSDDKKYWLARTPQERLQHLEFLRQINYGHLATARLQRILEIVER
jgi:hypothetical protein